MSKKQQKTELTEMEKDAIRAEIRALVSSLDAPTSSIGDWKIVKIYEARLKGEPDPYDYETLSAERQEVRDRINELEAQLEQCDD